MAPARIQPGTIGAIDWDYERTPGMEQARVLELPYWATGVIDECRRVASRAGPGAPLLQGTRGAFQTPANLRSRLRMLKDEFGAELDAAGIAVDELTFHTLRRTVLTAVDESAGRAISQAQAGHADAKTTAGYITSARTLPTVRGAAAAIDAAFGVSE